MHLSHLPDLCLLPLCRFTVEWDVNHRSRNILCLSPGFMLGANIYRENYLKACIMMVLFRTVVRLLKQHTQKYKHQRYYHIEPCPSCCFPIVWELASFLCLRIS